MARRQDRALIGPVFVDATITGREAHRGYRFLVDRCSTYMGLPIEEIEALRLTKIPEGTTEVLTANGIVELDMYLALGVVDGRGFAATVLPAPIPLIGYEVLQNLRFRVNPVSGDLERVPLDEPHPPYQLALLSRPTPHGRPT